MSACTSSPAPEALRDLLQKLLPGVTILEEVKIQADEGCGVRLDLVTSPTGKGTSPLLTGWQSGWVILLPQPHSVRWIVTIQLQAEDESLPNIRILGQPYNQWRTLARVRDDFDLLNKAGEDYFLERDTLPAKPRR